MEFDLFPPRMRYVDRGMMAAYGIEDKDVPLEESGSHQLLTPSNAKIFLKRVRESKLRKDNLMNYDYHDQMARERQQLIALLEAAIEHQTCIDCFRFR